jgi:hypothetical protein
MPLKLDLSQFSLNQFRSYARFDNGQEEKLRSALDHHFAVERFVCALETAIKQRPGILIGGVPIGESRDGQIVFQITCMHKIDNGVACDDFFTAVCHRESVEEFCAELEEQYQRSAGIYFSALDPKLTKKRAVRLHLAAGSWGTNRGKPLPILRWLYSLTSAIHVGNQSDSGKDRLDIRTDASVFASA